MRLKDIGKTNKLNFIVTIATSLCAVFSFLLTTSFFSAYAEDRPALPPKTNEAPPEFTCYARISPEAMIQIEISDLKKQLELLEQQYKDKKIDQKTYKQSKENILNDIKKLDEK